MSQEPAHFTPEAVEAMNQAYAAARSTLRGEGLGQDAYVKAGATIIHLARAGETDAHKLCVEAVREALGRPPRGSDGA